MKALLEWINNFIKAKEIYFLIGLAVISLYGGWWLHGIFYNAAETDLLRAELANYKALSKSYHDSSEAYQKLNQTLLNTQQEILDKAHETKDPICGSSPLPPARLQLLKKARISLAAS